MTITPIRNKQWVTLLLLFTLVGVGLWLTLTARNAQKEKLVSESETLVPPPASVTLSLAREKSFPHYQEVTGTVRSEWESNLAAKVMGRVQEVTVRQGDTVHPGQVLIRLEARDLDATVVQADAGLRSSKVGLARAQVVLQMESSLNIARIAEAKAKLAEAIANRNVVKAHLQLVEAGPRKQERMQSAQIVVAAKADFLLAETTLRRMTDLYQKEAIARQQLDQTQAQYDAAKAKYDQAVQGQSIADEGSRQEDIRAAQEMMTQAEASVTAAQAAVHTAEATTSQINVRQQEVQGAMAQIGQASAGLTLAKVNRQFANIIAPFPGVVAGRFADPGTLVNPGVPLLKIQGGASRLEAIVPESTLASIHIGDSVPIRFDALRSRTTGRIVEIAPQGDTTSHTFVIKIQIPASTRVSVGMFGRAQLLTGQERQLTVPASAIMTRDGLNYLYTVDNKQQAHLRMVTIGPGVSGSENGDSIIVLSGLTVGERVVISNTELLHDGSPVVERGQ